MLVSSAPFVTVTSLYIVQDLVLVLDLGGYTWFLIIERRISFALLLVKNAPVDRFPHGLLHDSPYSKWAHGAPRSLHPHAPLHLHLCI